MDVLVSVIVPVYKVEKYLKRCVDSILKQTYKNIEIILVDDGSPDNCPEICDLYGKLDSRVKVIHKKNGGVSSARNVGIDIAKGKFCFFIDSDDMVAPTYIENFLKEGVADYVVSGFITKNNEEETKYTLENMSYSLEEFVSNKNLYSRRFLYRAPWCKRFKTELIKKHNIKFKTDIKIGEDTIFVLEYLRYCKGIKSLRYVEYYAMVNKNSATHTFYSEMPIWQDKVLSVTHALFKEEVCLTPEALLTDYRYFTWMLHYVEECQNVIKKDYHNFLKNVYRAKAFKNALKYIFISGTRDQQIEVLCIWGKIYGSYEMILNVVNKMSRICKKMRGK